jgi:alcohol dehydrogenase class IV
LTAGHTGISTVSYYLPCNKQNLTLLLLQIAGYITKDHLKGIFLEVRIMNYVLDIPARVLVGADSRLEVAEEVRQRGWSRVLLVTDPYQTENGGQAGEIKKLLEEAGVGVSVYDGIRAEPDTQMVQAGLEQYQGEKCQGVVALGGGSPIDAAKTIAVMVNNEVPVQDLMGVDRVPRAGVGLIAIATTAGTGSEVTKVVVIADSGSQVKMTGRDRAFLPSVAIVDYKLTMSMPTALTAAVGVDALTHAIEAYVSAQANEFTDALALNAVKLITRSLQIAYEDGNDEEARREMMMGSFQAGVAFSNSSVCLVHSMSEPLGACFHVPHGLSNAMLLGAVTKFSVGAALRRYANIAHAMGLVEEGTDKREGCAALVNELYLLNQELKLQTPASFGIGQAEYEKQLGKMAADARAAGSTKNSPVSPTLEQIIEIYREIYTG